MTSQTLVTMVCRSEGKVKWTKRFDTTDLAIEYAEELVPNLPVYTTLEVWDTGNLVWKEEI